MDNDLDYQGRNHLHFHGDLVERLLTLYLSACITSILRTYYTWKIAQSPDVSYNMVPMGMWTYAELSTGIVISCLPVIPKFFQHVGPKVSSAFSLRFKSTTGPGHESSSRQPSDTVRAENLKLPSFKHTFTSFVTNTEKDTDHEMCQQTLPKGEYVMLHEDLAVSRRDPSSREVIQAPPSRLATARDDLERGYGIS